MKHDQRHSAWDEIHVSTDSARGSNQSGLRAHNERLVLTLIRRMGPLAKAEIARLTGLSAQTVSVIMRALEADGLLRKGAPIRGKIGQPSIPMDLSPDGAYFLGLKIGRGSLELVLTNFLGDVIGRVRNALRFLSPDDVVQFANAAITELTGQLLPKQQARVAGLGIALPFRLWDWPAMLSVETSNMEGWRDCDIAAEIAQSWNFPVYMRNDASAACGAELVFGDQNKPEDFLYLYVGFFVGGGLVLDNTLYSGRTGNAAALGSMPIGGLGAGMQQLVDVASLAVLEKSLIEHGLPTKLIWGGPTDWAIPDAILDIWLTNAATGLASAIVSSSCLIDFECVVIDGWMPADVRAELTARTARMLDQTQVAGIEVPDMREGTIGSDARCLGAASLPLSDRFLVNRNAILKG